MSCRSTAGTSAPPCLQKAKQTVLLRIACCHGDVHLAHALLDHKVTEEESMPDVSPCLEIEWLSITLARSPTAVLETFDTNIWFCGVTLSKWAQL